MRQYAFLIVRAKCRPLPTLMSDKLSCNVFHHVCTLVQKNLVCPFQTRSHQTNQKLVKKMSKALLVTTLRALLTVSVGDSLASAHDSLDYCYTPLICLCILMIVTANIIVNDIQNECFVPFKAAGRIIRRMKTHPAPLPPPPVKRLEPILPPMSDATLLNKQKLLNIVYSHLQGIVTHARFVNYSTLDSLFHFR